MILYYAGGRQACFKALPRLPAYLLLSYHDIVMPAGWHIQKAVLEKVLASRGDRRRVRVKK
jgi:hypothetical protein